MACIKLLLLLLVICNAEAKSAKILIVSYDVVASFHSHFMESLTVFLSEYHSITFLVNQLSTIKNKDLQNSANVDIILKGNASIDQSNKTKMEVKNGKNSPLEVIRQIAEQTEQTTRTLFANSRLLQQIESENYDLMIYNSMDYGMPVLCQYLNITCVQTITSGLGGVHNPLSLELVNSVPYMLSSNLQLDSLSKRLKNTLLYLVDHYLRIYYFYPGMEKIAQQNGLFDSIGSPQSYWQLAANTPEATLLYTNDAVDCHVSLPKSYTRVGGALLSHPFLDDEYHSLMDSASNGVVIVAFGRGYHQLSNYFLQQLMISFKQLPYQFIWSVGSKFPELMETNNSIPLNVHLASSIPQNSLLSHPNCKLFVTHAGFGSTTEAIYNAVPVVTIPSHADQQRNSLSLTQLLNMGVSLDSNSFSSNSLTSAIQHVLNNPKYLSNARSASNMIKNCVKGTADNRILETIDNVLSAPRRSMHKDMTEHWLNIVTADISSIIIIVLLSLFILILATLCFAISYNKKFIKVYLSSSKLCQDVVGFLKAHGAQYHSISVNTAMIFMYLYIISCPTL